MFKKMLSAAAAIAIAVCNLPQMQPEAAETASPIKIVNQSQVYTNGEKSYCIYHAQNTSWIGAQQFCYENDGCLVKIETEEEQAFLEQAVTDYLTANPDEDMKEAYIGLFKAEKGSPSGWIWAAGYTSLKDEKFSNWDATQPDAYKGKLTGDFWIGRMFTKTVTSETWAHNFGKWDDALNTRQQDCWFICEWDTVVLNKEYPLLTDEQRSQASVYNGHSYLIIPGVGNWYATETYAKLNGAHLVSVNDAKEQAFLIKLGAAFVKKNPDVENVCIGAYSSLLEPGEWKWADGSKFTYKNWYDNLPDNQNHVENFAAMALKTKAGSYWKVDGKPYDSYAGKWNDVNGGWSHYLLEWSTDITQSAVTGTAPAATEPVQTVPAETTTLTVSFAQQTTTTLGTTTLGTTTQTVAATADATAATGTGTVPKTLSLENGSQFEITGAGENVTFRSADKNVAVVSPAGVITAIGEGVTIISVVYEDGSVDQISVKVTPFVNHLPGDINEDGKVTVSDAILLARIVAEDQTVKVSDQGLKNADINGKDAITADDTTLLLKMIAGLV